MLLLPTLKFRLIKGCFQDASSRTDSDVDFLLEENSSWDDYGYHTCFFLHATKKLTNEGTKALGYICIMAVDKTSKNEWDASLLINEIGYENVFLSCRKIFVLYQQQLTYISG
ncbi:MAG: hypothetical protein HUK21_04540 [Fibrobacteraceae bacterium]|nr:hypothetical protein [Fibrobacteraceae bacterium]